MRGSELGRDATRGGEQDFVINAEDWKLGAIW